MRNLRFKKSRFRSLIVSTSPPLPPGCQCFSFTHTKPEHTSRACFGECPARETALRTENIAKKGLFGVFLGLKLEGFDHFHEEG
jgi:hypothetical protein